MEPASTQEKRTQKTRANLLALPPSDGSATEVVATFTLVPDLAKKIEAVGESHLKLQGKFFRAAQRKLASEGVKDKKGKNIVCEDSEEEVEEQKSGSDNADAAENGDADGEGNEEDYSKKKRTKADIDRDAANMEDYYAALGLSHLTFEASMNAIGKAYKKAALKYHPDKLGDKFTEKDKKVWLQVQKAYDNLSDPAKRKKYDSSLPFDEAIPARSDITDANFFEKFVSVFNNNARFSVKKPVPSLGDNKTSMDDVRKFYSFWNNFKTWREFSQYDEYDTEEANDRYEKRWMEQQNKKCRAKYDKDERKRLHKLIDTAQVTDPRIKKMQEAEQAAKDAKKMDKKSEKVRRAQEAEAKAQAIKDEEKRVADELAAKKLAEKKAIQEAGRKYRMSFKALVELCVTNMPGTNYDKFWCETIVKKYPKQEQLDALIEEVRAIEADSVEAFIEEIKVVVDAEARKKRDEEKKAQEEVKTEAAAAAPVVATSKEWPQEDIAKLTLGINKFPAGTSQRWQVISEFVGRGMKEVIAKAKELHAKKEKEVEERRQKEQELKDKREQFRLEAKKKVAEEAKAKAATRAAPVEEKKAAEPAVKSTEEFWSPKQQQQMETGMKDVPGSVPTKERWLKIAEGVDGKSAKECFGRFKELVAKAKAAK